MYKSVEADLFKPIKCFLQAVLLMIINQSLTVAEHQCATRGCSTKIPDSNEWRGFCEECDFAYSVKLSKLPPSVQHPLTCRHACHGAWLADCSLALSYDVRLQS